MNANSSCFRLSSLLMAAGLFAGALGALAQTTEPGARDEASASAESSNANTPPAEARREHGKRRNETGNKKKETAATAPTVAPFPAQPSGSDVICKYDQLSGSKVKRKTCGTAEQWAAWRKKNEENVEETTRKTRQGAGSIPRPDQSQRQMPPGG